MSCDLTFCLQRFTLAFIGLLLTTATVDAIAATTEYVHTDALGSVVAVTNSAGAVIERREYEPYGRQLSPALKDGPGYTGHVTDAATEFDYMQQRYYDPAIGRFLSVDPVTADTVTGSNFNRYKYANNGPYRFTDPDGRLDRERKDLERKDRRSLESHSSNTYSPSSFSQTSASAQGGRTSSISTAAAVAAPRGAAAAADALSGLKLSGLGWASIWAVVLSIPGDVPKRSNIVIGEGMARVVPYAMSMNAEFYMPERSMPERNYMASNRLWINEKMDENYRIIDIGTDPGKRFYPEVTSRYYQMELNEIERRGYPTYKVRVP